MKIEEVVQSSELETEFVNEQVDSSNEDRARIEESVAEVTTDRRMIKVEDLPSKYIPYPEGTKFYYRPYTFRELEEIESATKNGVPSVKILASLASEGIESNLPSILDMDLVDFVYVNMLRKVSTFDKSSFSLSDFDCPKCGHHTKELTVDTKRLVFADISEDVTELPITFTTVNGDYMEFKPLTVATTIKMLEDNIEDTTSTRLASKVVNMKYEEALEIIQATDDGEDLAWFKIIDELTNFENNYIEHTCSNCNTDIKIGVPGVLELATPFHRKDRPTKNRIGFGRK